MARLTACAVAISLFLSSAAMIACGGAVAPVGDEQSSSPSAPPSSTSPTPAPTPAPTLTPQPPIVVPPIVASSYDQTCTADTDCVAITEIADCGCACPNAAINTSSLAKEESDLDAHWAACVKLYPQQGCGVDCIANHVFCDASGTCRISTP